TAAAPSLFNEYLAKVKPTIKEITVADLDKVLTKDLVHGPPDTFHLFDVRETYEWNEGHIPYAYYTGRGCLERDIESLVPDTYDQIVVYCAGGARSVLAAESLQRLGYKNVSSLAGGIGAWRNAGMPVRQNFRSYSEKLSY
ncbi:hypothetical protein HDU76_000386, partial [Blyttiomyces sp. JEL0837]